MTHGIRVAMLDDHQSIVDGCVHALTEHPDIEVVGVITFGEELEPLLASRPVDLLFLDVVVPTAPTNSHPYPILHTIPALLKAYPSLHILIMSMHVGHRLIKAAMAAGARGYILKDDHATIRNLGAVVRSVAAGGIHFSQQAYRELHKDRHAEGGAVAARHLSREVNGDPH